MKSKPVLTAACFCFLLSCSKTFDKQGSLSAEEISNASADDENPGNFVEIGLNGFISTFQSVPFA